MPNVIDIGLEACNDQAFSAMDFVTWRMALEEVCVGLERGVLVFK